MLLELNFVWNPPLHRKFRDLPLPVVPARDIRCLADVHRATRVDERAGDVVVSRAQDELLVHLRRSGLLARDEPRADPHPGGPVQERSSKAAAVSDAACRDDDDGLAGEGTLGAFAEVDNCRDEDGEGRLAGVSAAFAALGADDVDA